MKRILTAIVVAFLLCSTTNITAYSTTLISTSFRTNLVKGEYVEDEAEDIITDRAEIEESEPQKSNEHTDVSTPTDIESAVIEDTGDLDQLEEPTQSEGSVDEQLDAPKNTGESTEPEVETPIDSEEEEEHETEVQSP